MDNHSNDIQVSDESDDSVEEVVPTNETASGDVESSSKRQKRKRKFTSKVWEDFPILEQLPDQPLRCACKRCGKKFIAESSCGTGNLIRHLKKCKAKTTKEIGQYMISSDKGILNVRNPKFRQEKFRELLNHAEVRHELPFSFSEYEGIRNVFKYLEPSVTFISRNTTKSDILKLYERESNRLCDELIRCPSRISLTSDAWTSIVTDGYLSLTAHYVDSDWVLQKRILNFSYMPPPHTGVALAEKLIGLVKSWGIEKKLFSITLDNASANDVCVNLLKKQFGLMNSLVYGGELFHLRCRCHILNLIVQDGLKEIDVAVEKVRDCVRYVKGSEGRKKKFAYCCTETLLDSKRFLMQDVPTRWNATYRMLSCALYYRYALCHLSLFEASFESCPSEDEWERVRKICDFLQVFYEATLDFSGTLYPTSNLFFPIVFEIHLKLAKELKSDDSYMKQADQMWLKFNKYWADFSTLLAVAIVFDPLYKYPFLEFSYHKLYGPESPQLKAVRKVLDGVFDEYVKESKISTSSTSCSRSSKQGNAEERGTSKSIYKEFDLYDSTESSSSGGFTELQLYLAEPRTKTHVRLLDFWKSQRYRYPVLAKLAMDIICVPVLTVASESAFSLGGRILDQYRSSMQPSTVEAVICTRDWLFGENLLSHDGLEEILVNVMASDNDNDETGAANPNLP